MNIALIGMMGTMKSSVGKELAKLTGMTLFDSDDEFVSEEGCSISDAFARKGEPYFRERERAIVKRLASEHNAIISCGGGVPLNSENVTALRASCVVVLLTATPECIFERTSGNSSRPLLAGGGLDRIKALCAERERFYAAAADIAVDTTARTPEPVAREIIEKVSRENKKA